MPGQSRLKPLLPGVAGNPGRLEFIRDRSMSGQSRLKPLLPGAAGNPGRREFIREGLMPGQSRLKPLLPGVAGNPGRREFIREGLMPGQSRLKPLLRLLDWSATIESICRFPRLLPVILHDVFQRIVEGILTEQLSQFIATLIPDIVQHLGNYQPDPLVLQDREE